MSVKSREKHVRMMHEATECLHCGIKVEERREIPEHLSSQCAMHSTKCIYCSAPVIYADKGDHQAICGQKMAQCLHCEHRDKRHAMRAHAEKAHNVWKPRAGTDWIVD